MFVVIKEISILLLRLARRHGLTWVVFAIQFANMAYRYGRFPDNSEGASELLAHLSLWLMHLPLTAVPTLKFCIDSTFVEVD